MFFILGKENILFTGNSGRELIVCTSKETIVYEWDKFLKELPERPKDPNSQPQPTDNLPAKIVVGSVSENFFVICDTKKNMLVFDRHFNVQKSFLLKRVCTKVKFGPGEKSIFVCDKAGDFYEFQMGSSIEDNGKCLLGHCSMLLDFQVSDDLRYLITADRDEKIRVTNYPQTYDILSYCMGHQEFVSSIRLLDSQRLVSASGDGRIILWNFLQGKKITEFSFDQDNTPKVIQSKNSEFAIRSIEIDNPKKPSFLAVFFFIKPEVFIFHIDDEKITKICQLKTDQVPAHVQFDCSHVNYLWIIGGTFDSVSGTCKNAEVFELKNSQLQKPFECSKMVDILNKNTELKKNIQEENENDRLELLVKHSFNNVEEYHERKRQRIQQEITSKQI